MSEVVLEICIPTYNRRDKVVSMVEFCISEFRGKSYRVVVLDNASDDGTFEKLHEKYSAVEEIVIRRNDSNLGLAGNLDLAYRLKGGKYLWVIGDDDKLAHGVGDFLYNSMAILEARGGACLFLNHIARNESGEITMEQAFEPSLDVRGGLLKVFKQNGSTMMFISSMIYQVEALQKLIADSPRYFSARLTLPLFVSLAMSERFGVLLLPERHFLTNVHGVTSWIGEARKVFLYDVPSELLRVAVVEKSTYALYLMIRYYFWKTFLKLRRR